VEWLWGSLAGAALACISYLIARAIRSHVSDAVTESKTYTDSKVKEVGDKTAEIELDLARHYVRRDGEEIGQLREDTKKSLRILTQLQIALAKTFSFSVDDNDGK
jgi:hypothetical protein